MTRDDGGPAFPPHLAEIHGVATHSGEFGMPGLSLRDYFAAQALNGMLASDSSVDRTTVIKSTWAAVAYEFADAMLKRRSA